jgi:uncharacterized alkaline shock family protein YloU
MWLRCPGVLIAYSDGVSQKGSRSKSTKLMYIEEMIGMQVTRVDVHIEDIDYSNAGE